MQKVTGSIPVFSTISPLFAGFFVPMPFVYILYSETSDKYYIGCTEDLTIRLTQHHAGRNTSTKTGIPWKLVHSEAFENLKDARQRESAIKKKKSRKYIEWLISGN